MEEDGVIWISWPEKSSKVHTDITEDLIRALAPANGLVDVKVCSVDELWWGLKLGDTCKIQIRKGLAGLGGSFFERKPVVFTLLQKY
jgi:hypothetical protein